DEFVVLRHELLVVAVRHHLGPQRLGQVAPDVLVQVGVLVFQRVRRLVAAHVAAALRGLSALLGRVALGRLGALFALRAALVRLRRAAAVARRPLRAAALRRALLARLLAHAAALLIVGLSLVGIVFPAAALWRRVLGEFDERIEVLEDVFLELAR